MTHELGCSCFVGKPCTCAAIRAERQPQPRDCSALFRTGACVLCGGVELTEAHANTHLADGSAVVQHTKAADHWRACILPTRDVPLQDESGISVFESDGDTWDRTDPNAEHLRAAIVKARVLSKETARKVRAARKAAGK